MDSIWIGDGQMEVRQLQIFRILAEELNFTRTAELVHTVQSNVTAQIRALEEELGVPLFDRLGRRVTLTDAGHRFLPFAVQALVAMEQGQSVVKAGSEPSGPLRISAPESIVTYRLPVLLRKFRRRFPHVELSFRPHVDASISLELESGKIDMVIDMRDSVANPAFQSMPLRTERVFLLAHGSHPLASLHIVKPADLAGQTLLLTEHGCGYRAKLDRVLTMQNIRPCHVTEFASVEAIKQCVAAAMGLALLPAIAVARELRQHHFKALHWAGPSFDIPTHILWHKDKWISPAMSAFRDLVKDSREETETEGNGLAISGTFAP
jgi:DNA-binding transcriptional LysR family regulator